MELEKEASETAKTRWDERAVPILLDKNSGLALDGRFIRGHRDRTEGAVIAAPHPQYGGSMENPVVTELAVACARSGIVSLRFDWRGVGGSGGEINAEMAIAEQDYTAALTHLEETVPGEMIICGYSFGAVVALRMAAQLMEAQALRVRRMILIAPPVEMIESKALQNFAGTTLVLVGEKDALSDARALQKKLGSMETVQFEVAPRADHFFTENLSSVGQEVFRWLSDSA